MELTFLGRGAAFYPAFGNTNAFFLSGGDLFFLDFGESAFEKAVRATKGAGAGSVESRDGAAEGASIIAGLPQLPQNLKPGVMAEPHWEQIF